MSHRFRLLLLQSWCPTRSQPTRIAQVSFSESIPNRFKMRRSISTHFCRKRNHSRYCTARLLNRRPIAWNNCRKRQQCRASCKQSRSKRTRKQQPWQRQLRAANCRGVSSSTSMERRTFAIRCQRLSLRLRPAAIRHMGKCVTCSNRLGSRAATGSCHFTHRKT